MELTFDHKPENKSYWIDDWGANQKKFAADSKFTFSKFSKGPAAPYNVANKEIKFKMVQENKKDLIYQSSPLVVDW